jgi:hypothetical protein
MVYIARVLLSGRQKIAFVILLALCGVFLAYYPRVTEAILAFCLGGVVPGTNIILSPDMVLALVGGVFGVGILAGLIRLYFHAHRRRSFVQIPIKEVNPGPVIIIAAQQPVESRNEGNARRPSLRRWHRARLFFTMLSRAISHAALVSHLRTKKVLDIISASSLKSGRLIVRALYAALVFIGIVCGVFLSLSVWLGTTTQRWSVRSARKLGRWALPRLRSLDAWLELQARKVEAKLTRRLKRHETMRSVVTVARMGRDYRKSIGAASPKAAITSARAKALHIKSKIIPSPNR